MRQIVDFRLQIENHTSTLCTYAHIFNLKSVILDVPIDTLLQVLRYRADEELALAKARAQC